LRTGRSALEALGVHPYDAERQVRGYIASDREQMHDLADLYDPDVPPHENDAYVKKFKEYLKRYEQIMRGNAAAFGNRVNRGWVPPSLEDVEAEKQAGD
jgi:CPA2 family monovalent cation:H+ antiporter-2